MVNQVKYHLHIRQKPINIKQDTLFLLNLPEESAQKLIIFNRL